MEMIDKPELHEDFKVLMKKPEWFKDKKPKQMLYLRSRSLDSWGNYMLTNKNTKKSSMRNDYEKWSGCTTWKEYLEILENGDEDIVKKVKVATQKATKKLEKEHEKIIVGYKFDVTGEQFDIGLVLSGVPEVWLEPEEIDKEIPKVTIRLNLTYSATTETDSVVENASKILAITKVLDEMGILVRLEGYNMAYNYDAIHRRRVIIIENTIKNFDEPLNFAKISAFISPAQFRRGCFYLLETCAEKLEGGYGKAFEHKGILNISNELEIKDFEKSLFKGFENG